MKVRILGFVLAMLFVFKVDGYALEHSSVEDIVAKMKVELDLNSQQVIAVKQIVKESMNKRQEVAQSIQGLPVINKADVRSKMKKIRQEENEKFKQVLTPEQMKKWIEKENLRASLNKDQIDSVEFYSDQGVTITPEGGTMQF